jgi:hypothetical protein
LAARAITVGKCVTGVSLTVLGVADFVPEDKAIAKPAEKIVDETVEAGANVVQEGKIAEEVFMNDRS